MESENKKEDVITLSNSVISQAWEPTCYLRFRIGDNFGKKLQQLWQGSNGTQEWRDVETVK